MLGQKLMMDVKSGEIIMSDENYVEMFEQLNEIKKTSASVLQKKLDDIRKDQFFSIEDKVEMALKMFEKEYNVFYSVLVTSQGLVIATGQEREYQGEPCGVGAHGLDLFNVSVAIIEDVLKTLINMQKDEQSLHLSDLTEKLSLGDLVFQNFMMFPTFGSVENGSLIEILQPFNLLLMPVEGVGFLMLVLDGKMEKESLKKIQISVPILIKNIKANLAL